MRRLRIGKTNIYQLTESEYRRIDMLKQLEPCDLMSIQEVAGRLDISVRTVYKYIKENRIEAVRIGRMWRIPVTAYLAFIYGSAAEKMEKTIADIEDKIFIRRNS